jgi:hypothetical protein
MHENRETSKTPVPNQTTRRWAKVTSRDARAYVFEGSDSDVVLVKRPNKTGQAVAEGAEGRSLTKENTHQSNTQPTQSGERVSQGLAGVRRAATVRKGEKFTALLHHVTIGLLRDSFYALKRKAAPGVDGVTWQGYETGVEDRLKDLHGSLSATSGVGSLLLYVASAKPLGNVGVLGDHRSHNREQTLGGDEIRFVERGVNLIHERSDRGL